MNKVGKTERLIKKLKKIASFSMTNKHYEKSLAALSACAHVLYVYNQRYTDEDIEKMLLEIGKKIISIPNDFSPNKIKPVNTVLYYDGFGHDLRGLAINMTKTIASLGYKLIYVTQSKVKGKQPHIIRELEPYSVVYEYIDMNSGYLNWIQELNRVFIKYSPQVAYYYTFPYDVAGTIVFNEYRNKVNRILVNLTDHAFWIGKNAFDLCSASRAMGAWINLSKRGIPIEKMFRMRTRIYIPEIIEMGALPFDKKELRYVFSGGALYKTLGDPNKYYYRIIEYIVRNYNDVAFLYAGGGDDTEFQKLITKYPERVFLVNEREDFYQIMQGCVFYLNTYPMFGGQMMRYAAYAGKIPVTLKHNEDGQGILFQQEQLGIEFDNYEEVIEEINRLLTDNQYRSEKESKLRIAIVSKEEYEESYITLIEEQKSPLPIVIEEYDVSKFQNEYLQRMEYKKMKEDCVATKNNACLISTFPLLFIKRLAHEKRHKGTPAL